jgi:hypothetical protein
METGTVAVARRRLNRDRLRQVVVMVVEMVAEDITSLLVHGSG